MKYALLFILIACIGQNAYSQRKFSQGTITINNGTIQQGFINENNPLKNTYQCEFKKEATSDFIVYTPAQLQAYAFPNGKKYESYKVLSSSGDSIWAFLQVLVEGKVSLYLLRDKRVGKNDRFFINKDKKGLYILNGSSQVKQDGQLYASEGNYSEFLKNTLDSCSAIQSQLIRPTYNEKYLIGLINSYNSCTSKPSVYSYKPSKILFTLGPKLGIVSSKMEAQKTTFSTAISIGAFVNARYSELSKRFSLQAELLYTSKQAYQYGFDYNPIQLKFAILQLPVLLKYNILKTRFSPYLQVGGFAYKYLNNETYTHPALRTMYGVGIEYQFFKHYIHVDYRHQNYTPTNYPFEIKSNTLTLGVSI